MTENNKKIAQVLIGGIVLIGIYNLLPKKDTSGGKTDPTGNGGASTLPEGSF